MRRTADNPHTVGWTRFDRRRSYRAVVSVAFAIAMLIPSYGVPSAHARSQHALKALNIGVLAPLTGDFASDGQDMIHGAQLAASEINKHGGIKGYRFNIVVGDTQNEKPDAVVSSIRRITAMSNAYAMMTGYADTTNFEINQMARLKMPYILSGGSAQTRDIVKKDPSKYPTVWSLTPSYDAYGTDPPRIWADWATKKLIKYANHKVYIVTSDNPYSQSISTGLISTFKHMNWSVVGNDTVPFGSVSDWSAEIAKIRSSNPAIVINTDYQPANEATFMKQFLQNPTKSLVFLQYGPSVPEFINLTKGQSTGVMYDLLGGPILSPKNKRGELVARKFKARYHAESGDYGIALYEEVYLYADALKKVGNPQNTLAVGRAIGQTDKVISEGRIKFDPNTHLAIQGDNYEPLQFFEIWHGKRLLLSPKKYATGSFHIPPWYH